MSKFIISGFADEIDPYIDKQMDVLDLLGIKHIEIRGADGKNVSKLSQAEAGEMAGRLSARGFRISPIGKIKVTDDFGPHLELFKHCLNLAQIFGTQNIRMFSFYAPEGADIADFRDEVMRRWESFLAAAQGTGITLLHENEKDIYGDIAERCLDLAQTLGIGLIFDPANFIQSGVETFPYAFGLLKKHIKYMHIKDARNDTKTVVPSGMGDGGIKNIIAALDGMGFEGFLSLEPHLGHFAGLADLEPVNKTKMLGEGGPKSYTIAAEALLGVMAELGIKPTLA